MKGAVAHCRGQMVHETVATGFSLKSNSSMSCTTPESIIATGASLSMHNKFAESLSSYLRFEGNM